MKKHGKQFALDEELILKATDALYQKFTSSQKPLDLKTCHNLDLGVTFKSIPKLRKQLRIRLPHPLYCQQTHTVCLLTCFPKDKVKQLIADSNVTCIKKVLTIQSLNRKYKRYEDKRELVTRYDVFLTDSKACPHVNKLLGKIFLQKHKIPQSIHLKPLSLSHEVEKAFSTLSFRLSIGSTSCVAVGSFDTLTSRQLADNVIQCIRTIMQKIPPGWSNLRNAYIKSFKSLALPIFTGLPTPPPLKITSERDSAATANPLPKSQAESACTSSEEEAVTSLEDRHSVLDRAGAYTRVNREKRLRRHEIGMGGRKKMYKLQKNINARKK